MDLKDAREIAKYVVPRLLEELPQDVKAELVNPRENEDGMLFRLTEQAASDIQWRATLLEQDAHPTRHFT